jgi:hypothetical protein
VEDSSAASSHRRILLLSALFRSVVSSMSPALIGVSEVDVISAEKEYVCPTIPEVGPEILLTIGP